MPSYAIGAHFERFVREKIESGRFSSASEVVREALGLLEENEELREAHIKTLRRQLEDGRESGPGIPADKVFDRIQGKFVNT